VAKKDANNSITKTNSNLEKAMELVAEGMNSTDPKIRKRAMWVSTLLSNVGEILKKEKRLRLGKSSSWKGALLRGVNNITKEIASKRTLSDKCGKGLNNFWNGVHDLSTLSSTRLNELTHRLAARKKPKPKNKSKSVKRVRK